MTALAQTIVISETLPHMTRLSLKTEARTLSSKRKRVPGERDPAIAAVASIDEQNANGRVRFEVGRRVIVDKTSPGVVLGCHQTSAYTAIKVQLDDGGIVNVVSERVRVETQKP